MTTETEPIKNDIGETLSLPVQFVKELSESSSIPEITEVIARWFFRIFHANRASITLLDENKQLKLIAIEGNSAIPAGVALPVDGTMIGRVISTGTTECCQDLSLSSDIDCKLLLSGNILSCMDAPLGGSGGYFGTINVGRSKVNAFTGEDQKKLEAMAYLISALMHIHQQADQLREIADLDPLTGLMNRRAFIRKFNSFPVMKEPAQGTGTALIDIDHFKCINDNYGHSIGDQALVHFCKILSKSIRQGDLLARFGGEEFCLIVTGISREHFNNLLERFIYTLRREPMQTPIGFVSIAASIGAAHFEKNPSDFESIYKKTDDALYRAKREGRDRIVFCLES